MYWITGILGLALMIAPFVVGYSNNIIAVWTSLLIGAAVAVVSGVEALRKETERWEYIAAVILGIAGILAPFVLNYTSHTQALWSSIMIGALITITAGSKLYTGKFLK